jgi:hypothetical protein
LATQVCRWKRRQRVEKHSPQILGKTSNTTNDRDPRRSRDKEAQSCFNQKGGGGRVEANQNHSETQQAKTYRFTPTKNISKSIAQVSRSTINLTKIKTKISGSS